MFEKLEYCPECDELLRGPGYDFQYCWICGWGVKERGPFCKDSENVSDNSPQPPESHERRK